MRADNLVELIAGGGSITRFHTQRVHHRQSVAEHSWGVAMILMHIAQGERLAIREHLLKQALIHDLSEMTTGDIPAPFKWHSSAEFTAELDEADFKFRRSYGLPDADPDTMIQNYLKWADYLELIVYARAELTLGNLNMAGMVARVRIVLNGLTPPSSYAKELLDELCK